MSRHSDNEKRKKRNKKKFLHEKKGVTNMKD